MDKIRVDIIGSFGRVQKIKKHTRKLKDDYKVNHFIEESFSSAEGIPPEDFLSVKVVVNTSFLGYIRPYLIKKSI